jgi:hypothetical protein
LLDLQRRVFRYRQPGEHRGTDRRAAGLAKRKRRLRIGVDEDFFDRRFAGRVGGDDFLQAFEDRLKPRGEIAGARLDAAARDVEK